MNLLKDKRVVIPMLCETTRLSSRDDLRNIKNDLEQLVTFPMCGKAANIHDY